MFPLSLPFFIGVQNERGNSGFPESYPFDLYFDTKLKLYRQKISRELDELLVKVYTGGSMLNGEMNSSEGKIYADAALNFISSCGVKLTQNKVLEIGCGNGYILSELEKQQAICTGIEPGPQAAAVNNLNIKIIRDFFPTDTLKEKFDLILHFNVLEHVADPEKAILEQMKLLNEGGSILLGVPNCEPYLFNNDVSLFVHEHCNYFTKESLIQIANSTGLVIAKFEEGVEGGMLFAELKKTGVNSTKEFRPFNPTKFENKVSFFNNKMAGIIGKYGEKSVAIYSPLRATNLLFMKGLLHTRFVDDKPSLKGKYLPGFINPIENFEEIKNNPPKCIIIFSRTFGNKIKQKCLAAPELKSTEIITLDSINSGLAAK